MVVGESSLLYFEALQALNSLAWLTVTPGKYLRTDQDVYDRDIFPQVTSGFFFFFFEDEPFSNTLFSECAVVF